MRTFLYRITLLIVLVLAACSAPRETNPEPAQPSPTVTPTVSIPTSTSTPFPSYTNTPAVPTRTPTPTPTAPIVLFQPTLNAPDVRPETYIDDACRYLSLRWDPNNSEPGTVVVPIMYHSILKEGKTPTDNTQITLDYFKQTVDYARYTGFETITAEQYADFLENNTRIPPRSVIFILDDRRPGTVQNYFLPILKAYDWTVTLAYITGIVPATEWAWLEDMAATGRLDVQAHGYLHNAHTYIKPDTPLDVIDQELNGPIPLIEEHFGYKPTAFIWPGGDYTQTAVEMAREAGYRIGLTVRDRGPVMFNWIPLGDEERAVDDPLMVLPRAWSSSAIYDLQRAAEMGDAAKAEADANKSTELTWFDAYCR